MAGNNFGVHLTIDIENCNREKLIDNKFIYRLLSDLPSKLNMQKITLPYTMEWKDKFSNIPGITGFVVIAESHCSIHTFPEQDYVFMDIFSCRHFETEKIIEFLKKEFGSDKATINIIERGNNFKTQ